METRVGSKISDLLKMKGRSRLAIKNSITQSLMNLDPEQIPGVRLKFLESRGFETEGGNWANIYALFEIDKFQESAEYISYALKGLGDLIKTCSVHSDIDSIGIQEMECGLPKYYYVLVYILSNGEDKEIKEDCFQSGGASYELRDYSTGL
jgi:hypothetical protein